MLTRRRRGMLATLGATAALGLAGVPAHAATSIYPAGGSTFSGGAQGWVVTEANCNAALLCSASGGYDGANGHPPGSLSADTTIALNLLSLFQSEVRLLSPDFEVRTAGAATLHVDRQFAPGGLLGLEPKVEYTVKLIDKTRGTESLAIQETLSGETPFSGADEAITVRAGHTYAIAIEAVTSSTVVAAGLTGSVSARFDNVELSVQSAVQGVSDGGQGVSDGGSGPRGAAGGGTQPVGAAFVQLAKQALVGPAVSRGQRVLVRLWCPKRLGHACRVAVVGLLRKGKPATGKRTVRVFRGKAKRIGLRVRPRLRHRVAKRKKLLFKQTVRAGGARTTVFKRLRVVRR